MFDLQPLRHTSTLPAWAGPRRHANGRNRRNLAVGARVGAEIKTQPEQSPFRPPGAGARTEP
jgi:hypothetical protein